MIGGGKLFKVGIEIGGKLGSSLKQSIRAAQMQVGGLGRNLTRTMNDAAAAGRQGFKGILGNALWQGAATGALAIGAGLASSVRVSMQFEKSMSSVQAKLNASASETAKLGDLAKKLGSETKFTASETADAMDFLAMAGFNTNAILDSTPGILKLAAMSNMDLATSADIVSNIIGGMGLQTKDTTRLVDVMAKTAVSGNLDVRMMGEAFKYAGPIMKQANVSIEQAGAAMAILGDSGIQASEAGTGLRGVLVRLAAPPKEAAAALQSLGVQTADAQGNLKSFPVLLKEIGKSLDKVQGSANRVELAEGLFGKLQIAAGLTLLDAAKKEGVGSLDERINRITDSVGTADRMAAKMQDNLAGALTRLSSAAEGFQLALVGPQGKSMQGFVDGLANMVGGATKFLNKFPQLSGAIVGVSVALIGLVALAPFIAATISVIGSLGGALAAFKLAAAGATAATAATGATATATVGTLGGLGAALGGLGAILTAPITLVVLAIAGIGVALVIAYKKVDWFRRMVDTWIGGFKRVWSGLGRGMLGIWNMVIAALAGDWTRFGKEWGTVTEGFGTAWKAFQQTWDKVWAEMAEAGRKWVKKIQNDVVYEFSQMGRDSGKRFMEEFFKMTPAGRIHAWAKELNARSAGPQQFGPPAPTPPKLPPAKTAPTGPLQLPPADTGSRLPNASPANNLVPFSANPSSLAMPARALGGPVFKGVDYLVGEKRPEVLRMPASGRVIPSLAQAERTAAVPGGPRTQPLTLVMQPGTIQVSVGSGDPGDIERAVATALERFRYELESSYRSLLSD